jgi:hypothetical protein
VYLQGIHAHKLTRMKAAVVTFLVSIVVHELVRGAARRFPRSRSHLAARG